MSLHPLLQSSGGGSCLAGPGSRHIWQQEMHLHSRAELDLSVSLVLDSAISILSLIPSNTRDLSNVFLRAKSGEASSSPMPSYPMPMPASMQPEVGAEAGLGAAVHVNENTSSADWFIPLADKVKEVQHIISLLSYYHGAEESVESEGGGPDLQGLCCVCAVYRYQCAWFAAPRVPGMWHVACGCGKLHALLSEEQLIAFVLNQF